MPLQLLLDSISHHSQPACPVFKKDGTYGPMVPIWQLVAYHMLTTIRLPNKKPSPPTIPHPNTLQKTNKELSSGEQKENHSPSVLCSFVYNKGMSLLLEELVLLDLICCQVACLPSASYCFIWLPSLSFIFIFFG